MKTGGNAFRKTHGGQTLWEILKACKLLCLGNLVLREVMTHYKWAHEGLLWYRIPCSVCKILAMHASLRKAITYNFSK